MNPLKHIFILILLLLTGLQVEGAYDAGGKTSGDSQYCLLNDGFIHPDLELDLIAYFRSNLELLELRDTTSQYISPCDQILEEEVFASPPGSLPQKVLCMLAEDLSKFPELRKLFDSPENVGGRFIKAWEKLLSKQAWRTSVDYLTKVTRYTDNGLQLVDEGGEIIVKQANGVKLGKLDPNDVLDPGQMKVKGEVSLRHFDPDVAGGLIVKKSWSNPTISQQGIDDVVTHLNRFGPNADNARMIDRLNRIKNGEIPITDYDKRFYTHELEELARYRNHGIPDGVSSGTYNGISAEDFYYNAHAASLESYSINELTLPLYHP